MAFVKRSGARDDGHRPKLEDKDISEFLRSHLSGYWLFKLFI
jgi:hypothetical protein